MLPLRTLRLCVRHCLNGLLDRISFDNKALVALALLTAASDPAQKDVLIRLIVNLLACEEGTYPPRMAYPGMRVAPAQGRGLK